MGLLINCILHDPNANHKVPHNFSDIDPEDHADSETDLNLTSLR